MGDPKANLIVEIKAFFMVVLCEITRHFLTCDGDCYLYKAIEWDDKSKTHRMTVMMTIERDDLYSVQVNFCPKCGRRLRKPNS